MKDDFTSQGRTLQQGTKIAGDRLQRIETKSGQSELSRESKPYSEYRVGIKSEQDPAKVAILKDAIGQARQESQQRLKSAVEDARKNATTGQRIERFLGQATGSMTGSQYRPYIAGAVGVAAALGTGYAIKKTAQKINERRVKKQDPVEYLKYKHGDFASAKKALNQPKAKGYQDLVPYVK